VIAWSFAFILTAGMAMPTTSAARGGGHDGGHGFGFGGGAHRAPVTAFANRPVMAGPVVARVSFPKSHFAAHSNFRFVSQRQNFSVRSGRQHAIGSHFFTLGYDGIWLDNFVYAPTVLVEQPQARPAPLAQSDPFVAVKTPSESHPGIILVRGNTKSYVVF